jgi:hypothetical protein
MGTSYTNYGQLGFWARDDTVELWLYLLVGEVDALPASAPWLRQARDDWYLQATVGFVGCVSADLDRHLVGSSEREAELLALVGMVRDRIASYGPLIPAKVATSFGIGGGKDLGDVSTDLLQRFTTAVAGLVRGKTTWDTSRRVQGVWSG